MIIIFPAETGRKLNALCMFNLRPVLMEERLEGKYIKQTCSKSLKKDGKPIHVRILVVTTKVPQRNFNQRCIQNPVKHLSWSLFTKIDSYWKLLTIFTKSSILDCWLVSVIFIIFVDCCCSCFFPGGSHQHAFHKRQSQKLTILHFLVNLPKCYIEN